MSDNDYDSNGILPNEYDPQEDPIHLQKKEIELLDSINGRLKEISEFNERQQDTQESVKRTLGAINANLFSIIFLMIVGLIFILL